MHTGYNQPTTKYVAGLYHIMGIQNGKPTNKGFNQKNDNE
jgi:hypothetical protein